MDNTGYLTGGIRGKEMRSHVLYTDETTIELFPKSRAGCGRFRTENRADVPIHETVKFSPKLMIAGGFCARGVTELHFVEDGHMVNGEYYKTKILPVYFDAMANSRLFPIKNKITFMQDGAPAHSTTQNLDVINRQVKRVWGKGIWPGNSPDLNPIENLWSILKSEIYKNPVPKTLPELKVRIHASWHNLKPALLEKLSHSFKNRVSEMSEAGGGISNY